MYIIFINFIVKPAEYAEIVQSEKFEKKKLRQTMMMMIYIKL